MVWTVCIVVLLVIVRVLCPRYLACYVASYLCCPLSTSCLLVVLLVTVCSVLTSFAEYIACCLLLNVTDYRVYPC